MHKNHRRKNKVKHFRPRWRYSLHWWKKSYWRADRAKTKTLMDHGRFDDFRDAHPKSILWDVL
jgi:hypothetical protein